MILLLLSSDDETDMASASGRVATDGQAPENHFLGGAEIQLRCLLSAPRLLQVLIKRQMQWQLHVDPAGSIYISDPRPKTFAQPTVG
jgi:hypothetical protein